MLSKQFIDTATRLCELCDRGQEQNDSAEADKLREELDILYETEQHGSLEEMNGFFREWYRRKHI